MRLADNYVIPPDEFYHDPELQDDSGYTVAMRLV